MKEDRAYETCLVAKVSRLIILKQKTRGIARLADENGDPPLLSAVIALRSRPNYHIETF
jgi:hypothetical protein